MVFAPHYLNQTCRVFTKFWSLGLFPNFSSSSITTVSQQYLNIAIPNVIFEILNKLITSICTEFSRNENRVCKEIFFKDQLNLPTARSISNSVKLLTFSMIWPPKYSVTLSGTEDTRISISLLIVSRLLWEHLFRSTRSCRLNTWK